jgi:hypothetical protein
MRNIFIILTFLTSLPCFAGKTYYFCKQAKTFPLPNLFVVEIDIMTVLSEGYIQKYFTWEEDGTVYDQGAYESKMSKIWFGGEYNYKFKVLHIPGEHNFVCKKISYNALSSEVKRYADDITPQTQQ